MYKNVIDDHVRAFNARNLSAFLICLNLSLDKLPACCPAFLYQQGTDAPVTVTGMFPGQGYNPLAQPLSFLTGLLGSVELYVDQLRLR